MKVVWDKKNIVCFIAFGASIAVASILAGFILLSAHNFTSKLLDPPKIELSETQRQSIESDISDFTEMSVDDVQRKMTKPVSRNKGELSVDVNTVQGVYRVKFNNINSKEPTMIEAFKP